MKLIIEDLIGGRKQVDTIVIPNVGDLIHNENNDKTFIVEKRHFHYEKTGNLEMIVIEIVKK